jgi:hypothetical protein
MKFLNDWGVIITGILRWLAGLNPYVISANDPAHLSFNDTFAYPPPMLWIATPLTWLPIMVSGCLMLLVSVAGFEIWSKHISRKSILLLSLLWLPLAQGIMLGQITLLFLVLLVFAELAFQKQRNYTAGILLAFTVLKPQVAFLPILYLLGLAVWQRRWKTVGSFAATSIILWGIAFVLGGFTIYVEWVKNLPNYSPNLPHWALISKPIGLSILILSIILWWQHGRTDIWGSLLLLNTLLLPLSIPYAISGIIFVVIRWKKSWCLTILALSWLIPGWLGGARNFDSMYNQTLAIAITGILAGLLPSEGKIWEYIRKGASQAGTQA